VIYCVFSFFNEYPVTNPKTNRTSANAPRAKIVSPKILDHFIVSTIDELRNSELRAYQYPYFTDAQVSIKPTSRRLPATIAIQPKLSDQK